jgi:TusA-related sulfurtransferase
MTIKRLDITGPVSAYCILTVEKKAKALLPSDELIITCDNIPAVTTQIPRIARYEGLVMESHRRSDGIWEITIRQPACRHLNKGQDP